MARLNATAMKIYNFIRERSIDDIPPTIREICAELSIRSTSTVHKYLNELVNEGLIDKYDNQNRAIKLPGVGAVRVPLLGKVAAGNPITAVEEVGEFVIWQAASQSTGELFALTIQGESMIEAGILDGDIVIVRRCSYADNGEIVVALVDREEATVKRFYKENGGYRLQPENSSMEPIYVDECEVLGRVISVIRYYE